jgi:hypothetical protein
MMLFYGGWVPGRKVVDKGPASDAQLSSCHGSMEVLSAEKMAIHSLHQSVKHIAGPVRGWVMICYVIISNILT